MGTEMRKSKAKFGCAFGPILRTQNSKKIARPVIMNRNCLEK